MKERWSIIKRRESQSSSKYYELGVKQNVGSYQMWTCASKGVNRFKSSYGGYYILKTYNITKFQ